MPIPRKVQSMLTWFLWQVTQHNMWNKLVSNHLVYENHLPSSIKVTVTVRQIDRSSITIGSDVQCGCCKLLLIPSIHSISKLALVAFYGTCRQIYHRWMLWVMQRNHVKLNAADVCFLFQHPLFEDCIRLWGTLSTSWFGYGSKLGANETNKSWVWLILIGIF